MNRLMNHLTNHLVSRRPHPSRHPRAPRRPHRTRPRPVLRLALACALFALAALSGGCTQDGRDTLVVLGPWTGPEGKAFEAMLKKLDDDTGYTYAYEGTSSLRETLVAQLEADAPPDVAILNSIGELTEYARRGRLKPLDKAAERAFAPWAGGLRVKGLLHTYWVPLKVDLKSLVWSKKGSSVGTSGPKWCIGLASQATSGWPGTDWIEDILLHQAGPTTYTDWATGRLSWQNSAVERAWRTWAELLGRRSPHSVEESLKTSFEGTADESGASRGLLNSLDCTHEHQGAFVRYLYAGDDVRVKPSAGFLQGDDKFRDTYEVSGDMAAVFSDNPDAQELVERLSGPRARRLWRDMASKVSQPEPQPLFPASDDPKPTDPIGRKIAGILTDQKNTLCFDASDVMPPSLRDAFHRAVLEYFRNPTDQRLKGLLEKLDSVREAATGSSDSSDSSSAGDEGQETTTRPPEGICAPSVG
ncbi:extracellular solute-binding protein [Streptomyces sp. NPDC002896]|uniref:extracellular solute-binding protein n=1 Tax=Streptomyces sp. NPDC002896 TaxID=3154438 RepID=UPI003322F007